MSPQNLTIIDITKEATTTEAYKNILVANVNDHVVRMGVMTEPYFWHLHPESDESFMVIEGSLFIDLEDRTVELFANQLFTIPQNVIYRTRPNGGRSVNLTFESTKMTTVRIERADNV